jgi:general secretion pathway protein H
MTSRRDPAAGVSLIEVLVVLAIVGVMAGVTTLGLGALDRDARGAAEAARLADRLQLAADAAIASQVPLALVRDARAYQFVEWDAAVRRWRPSTEGDLGTRHGLPAGLRLEPDPGEAGPILITPDLPQPPLVLSVTDGAAGWPVAFDGVAAAVLGGD